jgi:adenosine deaminase
MRAILAALALAFSAGSAAAAPPDLAKMSPGELTAFSHAFPKGGELHNHLGANVYAETMLAWAVEDGLCIDTAALSITRNCNGLKTAKELAGDPVLRSAILDSLSVRHAGFRDRLAHDQFFTAFGRWDYLEKRYPEALGMLMDELARQNTFYLEAMVTPLGGPSRVLGAQTGWKGSIEATREALAPGIEKLLPHARAVGDALEGGARSYLKCGTPQARPGCQVTLRFLAQAIREAPPEQVLAQLQLGAALVRADRRWVGLQLVAPEDGVIAIRDYSLHMQMVDQLTEHGRAVPAALHAGELTLKYATPRDLSFHVAEAVRVAGARRIGHGTDLPHEEGAEALATEMAAKGVAVEVNLSSTAAILEVDPKDHPVSWLRARGVPTALSTDDEAILRIDLSREYEVAARAGATYDDLRRSARNAIAFSFLAGEGLWLDPGVYQRLRPACAGQLGQSAPSGACAELIARSDKAREQWRHEQLLRTFETGR